MYYDITDEMDELEDEEESKYWLNVATAACHFYMGEYDKATGVEQLPASLEYSKFVQISIYFSFISAFKNKCY